ncbi:MAG: TniB family NTP-binding protein [Sinimarinibacterium flocculans]|uniref:TniB family NTP-binding protein n=1 Tax=Sinimarinibacterium flocculans TaxID=985250 RepID=UPI002E9E7D3E|nr:TniB family NTP-binding protein [Pseudomonadota bacterium]
MTSAHHISIVRSVSDALKKRVVSHPQFASAMASCERILARHTLGMSPSGLFVYGPSGVGKSHVATSFVDRAQSAYGRNNGTILHFTLSGTTALGDVYTDILKTLGDPNFTNGTIPGKLNRITDGLKARGTEIVIFDEMHHLFTAKLAGPKLLIDIANGLKALMDSAKVSILIFGIPDVLRLWHHDQQIRRRFNAPVPLTFFSYPDDRVTWTAIIKDLLGVLNQCSVTSTLPLGSVSDRTFLASNGSIAIASRILNEAAANALLRSDTEMSKADFSQAARSIVTVEDGNPMAFELSDAMVANACRSHATPQPAPRAPGVSAVLST